jgi:hypothetical protein
LEVTSLQVTIWLGECTTSENTGSMECPSQLTAKEEDEKRIIEITVTSIRHITYLSFDEKGLEYL